MLKKSPIAATLLVLGIAFITASWIYARFFSPGPDRIAGRIISNLNRELTELNREGNSLLQDSDDFWSHTSHAFFYYDSASLLNWTDNQFIPDWSLVQGAFEWRRIRVSSGDYIMRKWDRGDDRYLIGLICIYRDFKINNKYLQSGWNPLIFPTQEIELTSWDDKGSIQFSYSGTQLFSFKVKESSDAQNDVALGMYILGILLLVSGIAVVVQHLHRSGNAGVALSVITIALLGGRLLMIYAGPPMPGPLFDPSHFASSSYNRSIGDLFLNTLVVSSICSYLFWNVHRFQLIKSALRLRRLQQNILVVALLAACFFVFLFPYLFIETIFHNSTISLDITQSLQFDSFRLVSFGAIVLGCAASFMVSHVLFSLARRLIGVKFSNFILLVIVALAVFLIYSEYAERGYWITVSVGFVYFSVLFFSGLTRHLSRITFSSFLYVVIVLLAYGTQAALAVRRFSQEDRTNAQFRFATNFLVDRDYLGEYLLDETVSRIAGDPFIQSRINSPFLSKTPVKQKIKQVFLSSYFDRYEVKVSLFNAVGEPYDDLKDSNFATLIRAFENEANKTNYEHIYFVKNATEEAVKKYLAWIPISRFGQTSGYIVLELSLRRIIPRNVFPELLLDNRFSEYFKNRDFSYAFFNEGEIVSKFGRFNYERDFPLTLLETPTLYRSGVRVDDQFHVALEYEGTRVVVVSAAIYPFFYVVTNLAFWFSIGLFLALLALVVAGLISYLRNHNLNYSARIQLYVYTAFFVPLVVVCVATLGLINRSEERQLSLEFERKAQVLGEQIASQLVAYQADESLKQDLDNQLIALTKLDNIDASIFSTTGELISTTQPLIYEYGVVSNIISRKAWREIVGSKEQSFINHEQIGELGFNNAYYGLKSGESGELIGILSLPFFESEFSLERTQINVLAYIIVIFFLVFLLFTVLSQFALKTLTQPLHYIAQTLSRTTLTRQNKPIGWSSNDEIGLLVTQYNKMLENLEQSKIELSRSQKESAWREIAKQVAHEIKNPLTPMKLTLQQMEKALHENSLGSEKAAKAVKSLLAQLEILNDIAGSFSAFARMPAPILNRLELTSLIRRVVQLHSDTKEGTVEYHQVHFPVYVMGDDKLLSRVFSNIVLNALQAGNADGSIVVQISASVANGKCIVEFRDNGSGIDPELQEKIFTPYFTTKKSGSGLGLAIAKQGIEQNGGSIYFESTPGEGTTFRIELPTVE